MSVAQVSHDDVRLPFVSGRVQAASTSARGVRSTSIRKPALEASAHNFENVSAISWYETLPPPLP